ncbi:MAG: hypothetical protein ACU85V_17765, partial [Gammaproteobacteria bacterium]
VLAVPLAPVCAAWLAAHPPLVEKMGAKQRAVAPLRAMLGDEALRGHLAALIGALRQGFGELPLVITAPSPRAWVGITMAQAGSAPAEVGQREADSASVYMAEFLRTFGECGVDGLLLIEAESNPPAARDEVAWYQPVLNVAAHYRWAVGVELPAGTVLEGMPEGIAFTIADTPVEGSPSGIRLPDALWDGASAPAVPQGGFRFAAIPPDASPERVLEVLAALRA